MCHMITSNAAYCLIISAYIFLEEHYTTYVTLNIYWTRPSLTSSLLHPDKVILGEAKLTPILFCTGALNWMLDEVKSNKCFIIPKKSDQIS